MKRVPQIVQTVTVGSVVLVLGVLTPESPAVAQMAPSRLAPPAQERRSAPASSPSHQYDLHQRGTQGQSLQGGVHVDAHADYHVNKAERPVPGAEPQVRGERWHPWETQPSPRWTPGAERYTRPPHQWNR